MSEVTTMRIRYGTDYRWRGYVVRVVDGARIRSITGGRVIDVRIVNDPRDGYLNGQSFTAVVESLEEVTER